MIKGRALKRTVHLAGIALASSFPDALDPAEITSDGKEELSTA